MRSSTITIALASFTGALAASTYAPISQIGDGQVQAPTGAVPIPAPSSPALPPSSVYASTSTVSVPASTPIASVPASTPIPPPAAVSSKSSNATVIVSKSIGNTLTQSVISVTSAGKPSSTSKPPAIQSTAAGSSLVLNGGAGLSFAALVAYVLA